MSLATGSLFEASDWSNSGYWVPFSGVVASIFFYLLLYFYLDAIVPNEYGIKKHPLFCFKKDNPN